MTRWLLVAVLAAPLVSPAVASEEVNAAAIPRRSHSWTSRLPSVFVENRGQWPPEVRYSARGHGGSVWVLDGGFVVQLLEPAGSEATRTEPRRGVNLRFTFEGGSPAVVGDTPLPSRFHYFLGADPEGWVTDVPAWRGVRYEGLPSGAELRLLDDDGNLAINLRASAGRVVEPVVVRVDGAVQLRLDGEGGLLIETAVGVIRGFSDREPALHCVISGDRWAWQLPDVAVASQGVDSSLSFSSFLGGNSFDIGHAIVADDAGYTYVAGESASTNFPVTTGAFQTTLKGWDAFITKLAPDGQTLVYSSFLGGASFSDVAVGVSLDDTGSAYLSGGTRSVDFPTTIGAFDTTHNGGQDGFMAKVSPSGSTLLYSTFIGGTNDEALLDICVDPLGRAHAVGTTLSLDYPTTVGAIDLTMERSQDACLLRLSADGSMLEYSSYFGGASGEEGHGVALDSEGMVIIAGRTGLSGDILVTPDAYDQTHNGQTDAFVAKLDLDRGDLLYSTYLGGSSDEYLEDLAVDSTGAVIVTGSTYSASFPTTADAFDRFFNGNEDVFVAKLSPDGTDLIFGSFLGAASADEGYGVTVDTEDAVVVTGRTVNSNFPVTPDGFDTTWDGGWDVFVAKLSADGTELRYGTFMGASHSDSAFALALDGAGSAYVTGQTFSTDFPVTPGAVDPWYRGVSSESFVFKIDFPPWLDMGFAYPGTGGVEPLLIGTGSLVGGDPMAVTLQDALPGTTAWLVVGTQALEFFPFYGGTLVPAFQPPGGFFVTLVTDGTGSIPIEVTWPTGVPAGLALYLQYWIVDPGAAFGLSGSNAVLGVAAGD